MVFEKYAQYYDLLYQDKDYISEAKYVDTLIKKYNKNTTTTTLLDLGCGTGKHAELLTEYGYIVHGVDMSEQMLQKAIARAQNNSNLQFTLSNIQEFNFIRTYDVVTALFHVMSYQTTDRLLKEALNNIYKHIKKGGLFIFDCWYGPAVLYQQPETRVKRFENEHIKVTKIAEGILRENENIVEINYDIFIEDKNDKSIKEFEEIHRMRYFFKQEIEKLITEAGFTYIDDFEFMTNDTISKETWGSCFVVKK